MGYLIHTSQNGSQVHICGLPDPKPCAFCKARGEFLCDWPVKRPVHRLAHDIRHGDLVHPWYFGQDGSPIWRIIEIEARGAILLFTKKLVSRGDINRKSPLVPDIDTWYRHQDAEVWRLEPATCDAPICEMHAREVADDRHYCADHWNAWMEVN